VARGALILPQLSRFRRLRRGLSLAERRNLGVGDYADVISGVDSLIAQGFIDKDRVGAMGWSEGGYISAFITASSDRFKAVSVGAHLRLDDLLRKHRYHAVHAAIPARQSLGRRRDL